MSNEKTEIKHNKFQNNFTKYESFSQYLNNIFKYMPMKNYSLFPEEKNNSIFTQNNLLKYTKLDGSKSIILSNINSLPLKIQKEPNSDIVKTIKENLSFISSNTKYINNIPKIVFKPKIIFSEQPIFSQKNLNNNNIFNINKHANYFNEKKSIIFNNNKENARQLNPIIKEGVLDSNLFQEKEKEKESKNLFNSISNNQVINFKNSETNNIYRQDYYVKQFKVQYSIWLRNILNLKLMSFLDKIKSGKKNIKFYPLNSLTFTANPKYNDNKIFLSMKIKEILIVGINGNRSSNQKKNKENIELVEKMGEQYNNTNEDLIDFLNMTMEESIYMFYNSEQFLKFKNSTQAKINDNKFFSEKKFSLLENNGFIYLIKNFNGNSKS